LIDQTLQLWQINREITGNVSYPFNRAQRIEFSTGFQNISFKAQARTNGFSLNTGELLLDTTDDLPSSESLRFGKAGAALIYDTSIFGGTSPIAGQSYRLEYALAAGTLTYSTALADYRRYFRVSRQLTLAGRILHFGRYGSGGEDPRQQDLFLGYPALVRGYNADSFSTDECGSVIDNAGACLAFDRLLGSRIAVVNAEARVPLLGALGVIPSRAVPPVEAALFYDAGIAWRSTEKASFLGGSRKAVKSYGGSLRFNLLGFAIGQLSYVRPLDRPRDKWHWEFSFIPGF
jgi:outer membrane protein assembly factor BamA